MEKLKNLLDFLSPLPAWLRVIIVALVTVVISVCVLMTACTMASSCGITQSVVNNIDSDGNTIEMGVTPSTTTSTTVSPEVPINAPLKNSMWAVYLVLVLFSDSKEKRLDRRICVDAADSDDAVDKISSFLEASRWCDNERINSYSVVNVVSLPPLFYWD